MGNLLRILYKDDSSHKASDIFVDFENCRATEAEQGVWDEVAVTLERSSTILKQLQQYKGASNEIRTAISNPKDDQLQEKAWETLSPLVSLLKYFYQYSMELERTVPKLLHALCSKDMTPQQHLESQQALFKQFAEILDFVLEFDDLKMTNPSIQNDFSYYRRTLNRQRLSSEKGEEEEENEHDVSNEMANRMSLFYAAATPMMKMLSDVTTKFVTENKDLPLENTTDCLSAMCSICRTMIENPEYKSKFQSEETVMFCLRVMVGVIILYDHVHPVGAFAKSSSVNIKSCVKVLKDQPIAKVEGLMNALRYTTKHLNDDTTPRNIKALLA